MCLCVKECVLVCIVCVLVCTVAVERGMCSGVWIVSLFPPALFFCVSAGGNKKRLGECACHDSVSIPLIWVP